MEPLVVSSARLACSLGSAPSSLVVPPADRQCRDGLPVATVLDCAPLTNIQPFGLCRSRANPEVAEASAGLEGGLMPRPCRPVPLGPWTAGRSERRLDGAAPLDPGSTCDCAWSGVISILEPGAKGAGLP